jgi:pimeloyl-ACP methyl ester carboxylesterase
MFSHTMQAARGKGITMSKRALLTTFHFSARPAEGDFERTIPILLVCGEGLIASVWRPYADMLSARGYCGTIVEMDPLARNTKQITRDIETVIKNCGYWPPIVICHSLSTYIAQKYLESFSLSGLVMINPYPPYSMSLASRILQEIDTFSEVDSLMRNIYGVDNAMDIANLCQPPSHGRLHSLPSLVLREIANDEALRVKLEPGHYRN